MLGTEACCCNNSSFRSHNHQSLRFLKVFLLHKDGGGGGELENFALNLMLANHLLCRSTDTEKRLSVPSSTCINLTLANAVLFYTLQRNFSPAPPLESYFQSQGSPLPSPIIHRHLRISYFNENVMLFPPSANLTLHTKAIISPFIIVSYHVSHWDDRNENSSQP